MSDTPATVVDLAGNPVQPAGDTNQNVIALLRHFLAAAERGEVHAVAVLAVHPVGGLQTAWTHRTAPDQYGLHVAADSVRAGIMREITGGPCPSCGADPLGG